MPPAFNLSQDQTLQFNPIQSLTHRRLAPSPIAAASAATIEDKPRTNPLEGSARLHRVSTFIPVEPPDRPSSSPRLPPPKSSLSTDRKRPTPCLTTQASQSSKAPTPIGCQFVKERA